MSAHKLPRKCSKCPATATPSEAIAAGWHHEKKWNAPAVWTCSSCYKPPPRLLPRRHDADLTPAALVDQFLPRPALSIDPAWSTIASGTLVQVETGDGLAYAMRIADRGCWLGGPGTRPKGRWVPFSAAASWEWGNKPNAEWFGRIKAVAHELTGKEPAEVLQRLADLLEIRQALTTLGEIHIPSDLAHALEEMVEGGARDLLARRLYDAGWRAGMSRHDAGRRLSAAAYPGQICAAGHPLEQDTHAPDEIPCAHYPERRVSVPAALAVAGCACPFCGGEVVPARSRGVCEKDDCRYAGKRLVSCRKAWPEGDCRGTEAVCRVATCPEGWRLGPGLDHLVMVDATTYGVDSKVVFLGPGGTEFRPTEPAHFADALEQLWRVVSRKSLEDEFDRTRAKLRPRGGALRLLLVALAMGMPGRDE